MKPARQAAINLLTRFPNAATMTLARTAYKAAPTLWANLDACRKMFRTLRGANGNTKRKECPTKAFYREPKSPGDPFEKLPEPAKELETWKIVELPGPAKALVLSDVHIPYHDVVALRAALNYGRDRGADTIILNGDIGDHFAESDFEKDPRQKDFPDEIKKTREFLGIVRSGFPKARIVFKVGNHEERYIRYMRLKAPELLGMAEFELDKILQLPQFDIEFVTNRCPIRIGTEYLLHGHEYRFAIQNPVSPSRGLALRSIGVHAVCGHFHQTSQHSARSLSQTVYSTWSTGCLCGLHPQYLPINNWNHGFLFSEIDATGAFQMDNMRIFDGKVYR